MEKNNKLKRKIYAISLKLIMYICMVLCLGLTAFIICYVLIKGIPGINVNFLTSSPSYLTENIGILGDILNTLYIILASLIVVLPLGVGAAIYLSEYAKNKRIVALIEFATETLSGIPSIIYGLFGMLLFCRFLSLKTSLIAGALTLSIMNLPTVMRTTGESLKTIPAGYREGAFALGAGKWRTIRTVVLPNCMDGIITGSILTVGRITGESAALLFTAGFAHSVNGLIKGLMSSGSTLTVALYVYAKEQGEFAVAFSIGAILMILTLLINLSAELCGGAFKKRRGN